MALIPINSKVGVEELPNVDLAMHRAYLYSGLMSNLS